MAGVEAGQLKWEELAHVAHDHRRPGEAIEDPAVDESHDVASRRRTPPERGAIEFGVAVEHRPWLRRARMDV